MCLLHKRFSSPCLRSNEPSPEKPTAPSSLAASSIFRSSFANSSKTGPGTYSAVLLPALSQSNCQNKCSIPLRVGWAFQPANRTTLLAIAMKALAPIFARKGSHSWWPEVTRTREQNRRLPENDSRPFADEKLNVFIIANHLPSIDC